MCYYAVMMSRTIVRGVNIDADKFRRLVKEKGVSQTELARLSGVTRLTIAKMLTTDGPRIFSNTERKIAAALGLQPGALVRCDVRAWYLNHVADACGTLDFGGLGIVDPTEPILLDDGFAPLRVRAQEARPSDADPLGCARPRSSTRPRSKSNPVLLSAAMTQSTHMFLLGGPGAGKTTALRHVARAYALGNASEHGYPNKQLLPVFVRMAEWAEGLSADEGLQVLDAASSGLPEAHRREAGALLRKEAESGKLLLLLDGIDEVPDPDTARAPVIEHLRVFVADYPKVRVIITGRLVGFETPNLGVAFDQFVFEPLDAAGRRTFTTHWCAARHRHAPLRTCAECARKRERLEQVIEGHPRVRILAGNPMMLTILALLHEAGAALPQRRWELYEKLSEVFLFSWERKKRTALSRTPDRALTLDDREVAWTLESIALAMQLQDRTLVPRWWLAEHCRSFLRDELALDPDQASAESDALIWSLRERAGLLVEPAPERYAFRHLAFQEYFAARAILAKDAPVDAIRSFVYHPRWREVVRLVAAQQDGRSASRFLRVVLDDPDPTGRFLHRGLLSVLACLADGAPVRDGSLLNDVAQQVADLGKSRWLGIALEATCRLADLRDTRLESSATAMADAMLANAAVHLAPNEYDELLYHAYAIGLIKPSTAPRESRAGSKQNKPADPIVEECVELRKKAVKTLRVIPPKEFGSGWSRALLHQLRTAPSPEVRIVCANELVRCPRTPEVRHELGNALAHENDSGVREALVCALGRLAASGDVIQTLSRVLDHDKDNGVRGACAAALNSAARSDTGIRAKLEALLQSTDDPEVRAGAACGLSRCVSKSDEVRQLLLARLVDSDENGLVRRQALWALEPVLCDIPGTVPRVANLCVGPVARDLAVTAAQVLATAAATARVPWEELPIEQIEETLVNVKEPCPHILDALRSLMDAREARRLGIPLEARIRRALSDVLDRVRSMFVFGSCARSEQRADSDIDLLIVGDVSLREISPGLKRAEHEVGRQINVVMYDATEFRRRVRQRDPFLTEVMKQKVIHVVGGQNELAAMV
jgi:predicted nucleotidyltransferase/transcriptional regulator with XRE-family HTH domain